MTAKLLPGDLCRDCWDRENIVLTLVLAIVEPHRNEHSVLYLVFRAPNVAETTFGRWLEPVGSDDEA